MIANSMWKIYHRISFFTLFAYNVERSMENMEQECALAYDEYQEEEEWKH